MAGLRRAKGKVRRAKSKEGVRLLLLALCPSLFAQLIPRMILALGVTLELRAIEINLSQIASAVALRLIIKVRRRWLAALSAGSHGFRAHGLAELDDRNKALAPTALDFLCALV